MFKLIKNGEVYAPGFLGRKDILIAAGKIAAVADKVEPPSGCEVEVIDAGGLFATPGLIDIHVHIIGGGGESGPASRAPEITAEKIFSAGVTTVVGMLGTDDVTRHPESLLAKAQGLEKQGVTAFILAGSYKYPQVATITGDLRKDITLIPHVIGVGEIAISDHRGPQARFRDLAMLAADARVAGLLGDKPGLVVVHMGGGRDGMSQLFRLVRETEIPITNILPTHVSRNKAILDQAVEWAGLGGNLDLTAHGPGSTSQISLVKALATLRKGGVSLDRITVSSDSNGSKPRFDEHKNVIGWDVGEISDLILEIHRLLENEGMEPQEALPLFTTNPAHRIGLKGRKGEIAVDMDADITLWSPQWEVDSVLSGGRLAWKAN